MRNKVVATVLVVVLAMGASPVLASDLSSAVNSAVARELAQSRPAARGENPYKVSSLALIGGGATLMVLGFVFPSGAECTTDLNAMSAKCGTTANKGLLFGGAAAAGLGGFLYWKGERQRSLPEIVVHGGRFMVRERISW